MKFKNFEFLQKKISNPEFELGEEIFRIITLFSTDISLYSGSSLEVPEDCNQLLIELAKYIQLNSNNQSIDEMVFTISKGQSSEVEEKKEKTKKCIYIAKFYIKIAQLFRAIVITLNPVFKIKNQLGNTTILNSDQLSNALDNQKNLLFNSSLDIEFSNNCTERLKTLLNGYDSINNMKKSKNYELSLDLCKILNESYNIKDLPGIEEIVSLYSDKIILQQAGNEFKLIPFISSESEKQLQNDIINTYKIFNKSNPNKKLESLTSFDFEYSLGNKIDQEACSINSNSNQSIKSEREKLEFLFNTDLDQKISEIQEGKGKSDKRKDEDLLEKMEDDFNIKLDKLYQEELNKDNSEKYFYTLNHSKEIQFEKRKFERNKELIKKILKNPFISNLTVSNLPNELKAQVDLLRKKKINKKKIQLQEKKSRFQNHNPNIDDLSGRTRFNQKNILKDKELTQSSNRKYFKQYLQCLQNLKFNSDQTMSLLASILYQVFEEVEYKDSPKSTSKKPSPMIIISRSLDFFKLNELISRTKKILEKYRNNCEKFSLEAVSIYKKMIYEMELEKIQDQIDSLNELLIS